MVSQPSPVGLSRDSSVLKLTSNGRGRDQKILAPASSVDTGAIPNAKLVQPGVFARLQALFPPSFPFPQSPTTPSDISPTRSPPPPLQFLKARVITWNMHDSLPKGDLKELLGSVPSHTPRDILDHADRLRIPGLSMDEGHPYHIIVVAGQECPTPSGIPLGLAANFKHRDTKDKEKDKEKHQERDAEKDERKDNDLLNQTRHILSKHLRHEHGPQARLSGSPRGDSGPDISSYSPMHTSGWSAVLEDWFSNGVGSLHEMKPVVSGTVQTPSVHTSSSFVDRDQNATTPGPDVSSSLVYQSPDAVDIDRRPHNAESVAVSNSSAVSNINTRTGPYELLVKERLMGIYTAVYIHRDVRSLVRGFSTGAVPAGLIGGRLGNKGGVGVSIDLHGTTLLFINAHLAAHEGKVPLRVANLEKIKAELPLESWLTPDDPRTLAEDLTDRFDHSWIFGDLNFRLDISRLHADWLISRKEYSQAFAFDQLHKLMESGEGAFAGFNEAKIDFPPTFKYDVMRSLKSGRSKPHRDIKKIKVGAEEKYGDRINDHLYEGGEDDEEHDEVVSSQSSARTSIHSRPEDDVDSDHSPSPSNLRETGLLRSPSPRLVARVALKAKATWTTFLESSRDLNPTADSSRVKKRSSARLGLPGSSIELSGGTKVISEARSQTPLLRRAVSAQPSLEHQGREDNDDSQEDDKGIYDSSSKRRVPSWCDRILWKTTVEPPKEPPDSNRAAQKPQPLRSGKRTSRVGQNFFQGFRSRASRDSVDSESPTNHLVLSDSGSASKTASTPIPSHMRAAHETTQSTPLDLSRSKTPSRVSFDGAIPVSHDQLGLGRSTSATAARDGGVRRQSMPVSSNPSLPLHTTRRAESDKTTPISPDGPSPSPISPVMPILRAVSKLLFLNLLSRKRTFPSTPSNNTMTPQLPLLPTHRKGDVICLTYRTLDDSQMRRLEGRSDHRPVIGTFAIYV